MRRAVGTLGLALAILASAVPAGARDETLEVGLLPSLGARALLTVYRPLREYLQQNLERPVRMVTAPDYRTLIQRTRAGEYAYLVTAPHFARLAERESGYVPLVRARCDLTAIIVTSRRAGVGQVQALAGGAVATPDSLAIVSMLGARLFADAGLVPGVDLTLVAYPSFASAVVAAGRGEVSGAVTAETALNQMSPETRGSVKVIAESPSVPPVMLIARGDTDPEERAAITRLLLRFDRTEAGRAFFKRTRFQGYRVPLARELETLDEYVVQLEKLLARR